MSESEELHLGICADRSATGPATWGQKAIWDALSVLGDDGVRYNMPVGFPVDPGLARAAVLDAVTEAVRLHESLRTRFARDASGELRQILDASGHVPVTVRRAEPGDVEKAGADLLSDLIAPFDVAADWPLRVGLVEADGLVRHYSMVLSHTAADGGGLRRLARDVLLLMRGASAAELRASYRATQPLEEAAAQNSERGRRRDAASRRHWRNKLSSGPRRLFTERAERDPQALFPNATFRSPALLLAIDHVAATRRVSASSVLLASVTRQVSRLSGAGAPILQLVVNNRFLPGMGDSVCTIAQEGLFQIREVDADFGELVQRVHAGALSAYRHASYDKRELDRDIERLRADLPDIADHSCFFNDTREPELFRFPVAEGDARPGLERARAQSTLFWREFPPRENFTFGLDAKDAQGAIELIMTADGALLPRTDMEGMLRGIEETIVEDALATGCV